MRGTRRRAHGRRACETATGKNGSKEVPPRADPRFSFSCTRWTLHPGSSFQMFFLCTAVNKGAARSPGRLSAALLLLKLWNLSIWVITLQGCDVIL
ncbi:hypothetical protein MHYP_G00337830 [Metynnis hypsauchen]